MVATDTPDSLRSLFQSPFNLEEWYSFLEKFLQASKLRSTPERIIGNSTDKGYYLGNIDTIDSFSIGLFHYKITKGSVANKRVGLRNLVKSFINPKWGEFDAALVVFESGDLWRLSFICDIKEEATSPKRYTYVFGSNELLYRTPIERFNFLKNKGVSFENLKTAFSVEALSDEFFDKYREQYADFIQYVTGKRFVKVGSKWEEKVLGKPNKTLMLAFGHDEKKIRDYVKKMMGRITFLHFLQRKKWLCGDLNYMQNMFTASPHKNDYLDSVLEPLFFGILNTRPTERKALFAEYGWDKSLLKEWKDIPYLNGGLFERDEEDETECKFPADYFERLFQFFSEYNFTIDENDPNDAEVGVDPEMLGKIFENLLEDNKDKGAFYTPKEIVRYMCQESLIAYLETNTSIAKEKIRQFVLSPEDGIAGIPDSKRPKLLTALEEVKICDPAIGSGAFPMGLLNALLRCREALSGEHYNRAEIKKSIIQNNIYGVDIEKGAVDIARLRFWLSIVVDEETASPLPNLDYKIMQGNSLIESFKGVDLSRLTYEKENKDDKGTLSLFDDEKNRLQKTVSNLLSKYYSCSDHDKKVEQQQEISDTITQQLEARAYSRDILRELKNINLAENNKFFLWHTWFSDVFNRDDDNKTGFDIVIGNPPYLKEGRTSKSIFDVVKDSLYYQGKMDIWYLFACHGIDILKPGGSLCFIATNNWTTNDGAKKLRKKVLDDTQILQLCDFRNYMVFESASIQTMIMLFRKNHTDENTLEYTFDYRQFTSSGSSIEDVKKLLSKASFDKAEYLSPLFNKKALQDKTFNFVNDKSNSILNKINEKGCFHLDDYGTLNEITSGVDVLQDCVNKKALKKLSRNHYIGEGIFVIDDLKRKEIGILPNELDIIKPYYTTEQLTRYCNRSTNREWLIYSGADMNDKIDSFPNIKKHLDEFLDVMTSVNKPYGLHRTRKQDSFEGEKILSLRKCVDRPSFSYVASDSFVSRAFMVINTSRINLKYLTGILNSKLVAFWLRQKGKMQGLNYQIDKGPLQDIPIAIGDKIIENRVITIVERIINIIQNNESPNISHLEDELDEIVYELYGLTDAEIKIVEQNV